jgi:hypothetical protein
MKASDIKAVVSVAEMARMVGLSRARFYQLVNEGVFPSPIYNVKTRRPFFTDSMQGVCLEVRRRNCGVNGRAVLFYAARVGSVVAKTKLTKKTPMQKSDQFDELVEGLRCLGMTTVSTAQVESALKRCFPNGKNGADDGTVLRAVFLFLKRQDSPGNV